LETRVGVHLGEPRVRCLLGIAAAAATTTTAAPAGSSSSSISLLLLFRHGVCASGSLDGVINA
jgi:hypothetical protein